MFPKHKGPDGPTTWQKVVIGIILLGLLSGFVTFVQRFQSIPRLNERVTELEAEAARMRFAIQVSKAYKYECACEAEKSTKDWPSPVGDLVELPGE